jgi:threonine-phosphate decarboxylase
MLDAIRRALECPETLAAYPNLELLELKKTIADCVGVRPENIAIANGFVPLLEAALRLLRVERCLLPVPSFSEYRRTLENNDVAVIPYRLPSDKDFCYEPDALLKALVDNSCDSVLLANPQNPSGALCKAGQMRLLIELAEKHKMTVLLDEAFIDYAPLQSLVLNAADRPNVIVFRSVTKFFACPGLRVAYAVGTSSTIQYLNRFIAPWPVTSLASDAVGAALGDEAYAAESRIVNERRRSWLEKELVRLGIATYPANANFLLLRFPDAVDVGLVWERMIVEEQVVLRSCANFEGLAAGHLRIAVRSEIENERLIRGLERVLNSV